MVAPFVVLLASIALMPFISHRIWHRHFPDFSFGLGGLVVGYYLVAFNQPADHGLTLGLERVVHAMVEFYSFIALVGGLYVVSGSILIQTRGVARPVANTALLTAGAVLANLVGTTGASVLLIRPFMRLNQGRLRPLHVVFFIFIVSNCAGCLTPIGDPPLYLGFLKGVPFLWTFEHLLPDWLACTAVLLATFFVFDALVERGRRKKGVQTPPDSAWLPQVSISGGKGVACLCLMVLGVFIDPLLERVAGISGLPIGATFQVLVACSAYGIAPKHILSANEFTFFPVQEVGLLFVGIFLTMIPALEYLSEHGPMLGLESPTSYYFWTGTLSAALDNAPTYMTFLQVALAPKEVSRAAVLEYIAHPGGLSHLRAISTGAVFFGAMTYIGNGPNFMVRSIAQAAGVKMPSFFGYVGWAVLILLPILAFHWVVLIR
jgi:Na+/H+ antiporter NhaD/arsenite permease-like protein